MSLPILYAVLVLEIAFVSSQDKTLSIISNTADFIVAIYNEVRLKF
jgi:hypothetical protein